MDVVTGAQLERPPFFVGAGVIKSKERILHYARSPYLRAQVIGSFSEPEWGGADPTGTKRRFYWDEAAGAAYNAFGLDNCGRKAANEFLPHSIKAVQDAGQLAIVSVVALANEDPAKVMPDLAEWAMECGADGVEINLSCPNQKLHGLICENTDMTLETLTSSREKVGPGIHIQVKVSPLTRPVIRAYRTDYHLPVNAIAAVNNCRRLSPLNPETGMPFIEVNDGYAGQSGPIVCDMSRDNLSMWVRQDEGYGEPFPVWTIGGIVSGVEAHYRVNKLGAVMAGGAQHFFRSQDPLSGIDPLTEIEKWAQEYRLAVAA